MKTKISVVATLAFCSTSFNLIPSVSAAPRSAKPSLPALFAAAAEAFWKAEPKFHIYHNPISSIRPLEPGDPAISAYRRAAQTAEAFLKAQKQPSQGTPIMLYFAAMSYDRLGNHAKTLVYLDRLLKEFPDYKRPRVDGDPIFDHAVRADLLHLKLWHTRQMGKAPETLESLRQLTQDAAEIAALRVDEERGWQNYPDLDRVAPTSDMLRTVALPDAVQMAMEANDAALPALVKTKDVKSVRDYLRSLNRQPVAVHFADYANMKLLDLDKVILAGYRSEAEKAMRENRFAAAVTVYKRMAEDYAGFSAAEEATAGLRKATIGGHRFAAQRAMKANNFDEAKASWRKIVAKFPDSDEANAADGELKKIVPVAVNFYKVEGDKNYRPDDEPGVPQAKSREFFEKMYREDPDGLQADYALLNWARALGTENKSSQAIQQLKVFVDKYPQSPLEPKRCFYWASFTVGHVSTTARKP